MKKVAFITLGCKVNQYETNAMIQQFIKKGYEIVEATKKADIYIVNTCTVTNMSDRKSRQMLRRVKEQNDKALVIACGCYVQVAKEEVEKIQEIDLALGNNEKKEIVERIEKYIIEKQKHDAIQDVMYQKEYVELGETTYTEKTRAVIKVQDGCDRFCSYCIIPYARGRICSRKPESVIDEIREIANNGIKEVVITGIQVSSYGKEFENNYRLIDLLEDINKVDGIERIRLGSLEPLIITDEFCERLRKIDKMCHHFHLSLQSGCDKTLKEMNRKYTIADFKDVVSRLKKLYDDVILTTDIIVGFPNETDEDFEMTYQFLKYIKFYKTHVFKFSPRKGTVAAKMKNQVDAKIKEERSKRLIELSSENQSQYLKSYVGKDVEVLFEEEENGVLKGHTANYIMVKSKQDTNKINEIVNVRVSGLGNEFLNA